ncbi:MFS transporter [Streptomyces sp. O3]
MAAHQEPGSAEQSGRTVPAAPGGARAEGAPHEGDRWALVAVAGVLAFVAMLDMNIVNVALADISDGLGVSAATAQWAALGYQLPVVALLLPVGRWLDTVGTRPALMAATCGFALCSAAAALAPWLAWLIAARVGQGAFAAVLFVLMPVLAMRSVRPELRGRAMSVPATLGPLGAVTGPAVGGLLVDHLGWRAVFFVKLPFCLLALIVTWRVMPKAVGGGLRRPDQRTSADALLVGTGVAALLLALSFGSDTPAWLLLALVAVPPLWWWLRGPGGRPVTGVLRTGGLWRPHGSVLALAAGFAAMHYVIALHLQTGEGASATATGLTMLAFPLGMGLAGPLGGRLADRYGARPVASVGASLTACGLLLLVPFGDGWSSLDVAWRLAVAGVGMGLNGGPTQALVMSSAPPGRAATVGSTVQLSRSLGFTLGPALATAAWGLAEAGTDGQPGLTGARAGLALAATAACVAVPLILSARRPGTPQPQPQSESDSESQPQPSADAAPAARR